MSTEFTPVPEPLPATLDLPEDAVDDLVVETVNTNTSAIANALFLESRQPAFWFSLDNVTKSPPNRFEITSFDVYSAYGSWNNGVTGVKVPYPGVYKVSVNAVINRTTGAGALVEAMIVTRTSGGVPTTRGYASGYRYDAAEAMPARVTGYVLILITDPEEQLIAIVPGSNDQTPVIESSVGRLHQVVIERVRNLP